MGGKSKPTIGYWYRYLMHFGISQVLDALLEVRGGEKTAWAGRAEGGTIAIDARELWGGEKAEGGIEGDLDVMLGRGDQVPSARLAGLLGDQQSAYHNRASVVFEGLYGAFNPYPKAPSFKGVRIFEGWEDDTVWYPEKAEVPLEAGIEEEQWIHVALVCNGGEVSMYRGGKRKGVASLGFVPNGGIGGQSTVGAYSAIDGLYYYGLIDRFRATKAVRFTGDFNPNALGYGPGEDSHWAQVIMDLPMDGTEGSPDFVDTMGNEWTTTGAANITTADAVAGGASGEFAGGFVSTPYTAGLNLGTAWTIDCWVRPEALDGCIFCVNQLDDQHAGYSLRVGADGRLVAVFGENFWPAEPIIIEESPELADTGMNPAHILYDSLTHSSMEGIPIDMIDDASFTAAADQFYAEGFGLCTKFNPVSETVEAFQKRILNVAGANMPRSRVDGKYYLIPVRGVHDLESLPILEDDDILEYEEEPSDPLESVNQVAVEWFDQTNKKKRTTTPIQSLGAIQSAGGILGEVASYPEIPVEFLALRVAARDLAQKGRLKRFRLTTNRVPYAWRAGDYFRLQAPRRGIADMVCMVGEIDAGTPRSGSMRLVAIQDVSSMPETSYVRPEPGVDTSPSQVPTVPLAQQLLEAPYVDLAGDLPAAELAALADDAGFVLAVASRPFSGLNYTLYTGADGEALADRGSGDWCPTALVVEAGVRDPGQVAFTMEEGLDLALVEVGTAALWGAELVRVDAIDVDAMTLTLGRGCGDTTPGVHAAGTRIWFYDTWAASDRREYAGGETVSAKIRTRTSSQLLDAAVAPTLTLDMDERAVRPYPPGALAISDLLVTDAVNPSACFGELTVSWSHRDRLQQADQLVDGAAGDVGPEAGTTYTVRYYVDGVLDETETGITGTAATPYTLSGNGLGRVEVEAVRDGFTSWQAAVAEFSYAVNTNDTRVVVGGDRRVIVGGDARTSRG